MEETLSLIQFERKYSHQGINNHYTEVAGGHTKREVYKFGWLA